jgi:hypothetical protein
MANKEEIQDSHVETTMDSIRAREVVSEILNFGVNETQIKKIIKFLSLELVDRSLMIKLTSIIDESFENVNDVKTKIEI